MRADVENRVDREPPRSRKALDVVDWVDAKRQYAAVNRPIAGAFEELPKDFAHAWRASRLRSALLAGGGRAGAQVGLRARPTMRRRALDNPVQTVQGNSGRPPSTKSSLLLKASPSGDREVHRDRTAIALPQEHTF